MTSAHGKIFTAGEAARECGVDRTTIARAAAAGRIPGAERDKAGAWTLPLSGLLTAGYNPGKPSPPEDAAPRERDEDAPVPAEVFRLTVELERARAEARAHAARADALETAANAYWQLQLEAGPKQAADAPQTVEPSTPMPIPQPAPTPPPTGTPGAGRPQAGWFRRKWDAVKSG